MKLDMNFCITEVVVKACVSPALISERFTMLHAMIVAILHRNVGSEVGKFSVIQSNLICIHKGVCCEDSMAVVTFPLPF